MATYTMLFIVYIVLLSFLSEINVAGSSSCHTRKCYEQKSPPDHCKCDPRCIEFSDCCLDAMAYNRSDMQANVNRHTCIGLPFETFGIFMKMDCQDGWGETHVASLCAAASSKRISIRDPLSSLPFTNTLTNVTYPNYYCAICNDDMNRLKVWHSVLKCDFRAEGVLEKILNFTGWSTYDTEFDYTKWQNYNVTSSYLQWDIYDELSENQGLQKYVKSNLYFCDFHNSWVFQIPDSSKQIVKCQILRFRPDEARMCPLTINACAFEWRNKLVEDLCLSSVDPVEDKYSVSNNPYRKIAYRNLFCALCNHVPVESIACYARFGFFIPPSFSILLSVPDLLQSEYSSSSFHCAENETFIPGYSVCHSTICRISSEVHNSGICLARTSATSSNIDDGNDYLLRKKSTYRTIFDNTTWETKDSPCNDQQVFVSNGDFYLLDNHTVLIGSKSIQLNGPYQRVQGGIILCFPLSKITTFLSWISFIGLVASVICLFLHLVAFVLLKSFKNLSGKNLASLCMCLLTAIVLLIISPTQMPKTSQCYVSATFMYFSFFASFCWMNVIAFDIWHSFRTVTLTLHLRQGDQWVRFIAYSLYSWLFAIIAVAAMVATDQLTPQGLPSHFYPQLGQRGCWFGQNRALLLFFVIPVFAFITLNGFLFTSTAYILSNNKALPHENISVVDRHLFKIHWRLAALMGITWITAIFAYFLDNEVAWHVFILLNSLQGVYIFICFTCHRKVWAEILVSCGCSSEAATNSESDGQTNRGYDANETRPPYSTPRLELLHVSTSLDRHYQPSRIS